MSELVVGALALLAGGGIGFWIGLRRSERAVRSLERSVAGGLEFHPSGWKSLDRLASRLSRERLDAAERLAQSEGEGDILRRVLDGFPDPVMLVGGGGEIRFANRAARQVVGDSQDGEGHLLHHRLLEILRTAGPQPRMSILERLEGQQTYAATTQRRAGGDVLIVLRNVTEEQRVGEMRRDFVADASHELKTPVAAIQAASETVLAALEDGDLESSRSFARQVAESSLRLSRIVSDLLDLSRLEAQPVSVGEVDLTRLLGEIVEHSLGLPKPTLVAPDDPVVVLGSAPDLRLAVANLIANSVRHTPAEGTVGVRLLPGPQHVEIQVADTGEGIPSKHLSRIFERFYRVDPARSRDKGGTGLGLSIVRHVITQHGGSVHVESVLGEGTAFTVRLPWPDPAATSIPRNGHFPAPHAGPV